MGDGVVKIAEGAAVTTAACSGEVTRTRGLTKTATMKMPLIPMHRDGGLRTRKVKGERRIHLSFTEPRRRGCYDSVLDPDIAEDDDCNLRG